jgi:hypothetical protein
MKRRKKLLTRPMIMKKPVMFKLMIPLWSWTKKAKKRKKKLKLLISSLKIAVMYSHWSLNYSALHQSHRESISLWSYLSGVTNWLKCSTIRKLKNGLRLKMLS